MPQIPEWLTIVLKESPTLGVCVIIFWIWLRYITSSHESHLVSKDSEIERLVKEKNQLQQLFLKERLSTRPALPPPDEGKK